MRAYHFTGNALRDGGAIPPSGKTLTYDGPLDLCRSGLHASRRAFDALQYAPGPMLHRVRLGGTIVHGHDKAVASERTIIASLDAADVLRRFARLCALDVIHLWEDAPAVVVRYLKTGNPSLRGAARDAAWDAARGAPWGAARATAWSSPTWAAHRRRFARMINGAFRQAA